MASFPSNTIPRVLSVAFCALALSVCGGGSKSGPSEPSIPTPTPTPAPTPEPIPTIAPLSQSCAKLPMGDPTASCHDDVPDFADDVYEAIDILQQEQPEIFDGTRVLNVGAYFVGIIEILDRRGICAHTDNGEELGVKRNNDYSEQYDILTSKDLIRRYYVGTCTPAVFPVGEPPIYPVPKGCSLPPSYYIACGRPGSGLYIDDVEAAIDQFMQEHPELFDPSDFVPPGWPRVKDPAAYQNGVVDILAGKGYCGIFDGEEITLKRTNEFSEHYDINYADDYVRRGPGIYRAACYPAAF
jgi:hypothetical protein